MRRADSPPAGDPMLYLDGDGGGVVNNVCFPSTVAPSYAPSGKVRPAARPSLAAVCAIRCQSAEDSSTGPTSFSRMGAIATLSADISGRSIAPGLFGSADIFSSSDSTS